MNPIDRRSFLALGATLPTALRAAGKKHIPVGLEMYSVREELARDPQGTTRAVAKMGYQNVEYFAPYFDWTEGLTKELKSILDGVGVTCLSTHNSPRYLDSDNIAKTRDRNMMLGSKFVVLASAGHITTLDGWKGVAEKLNRAAEFLKGSGMRTGYHNHELEFTPIEGKRPIEILAKETDPSVVLQLDVGTCIAAGSDPVAWIHDNPGRIASMHCKEWSRAKGFHVLFGDGAADWKAIFQAAENGGGIEFYLIEQEGSDYSEFETAKRCLKTFRKIHG